MFCVGNLAIQRLHTISDTHPVYDHKHLSPSPGTRQPDPYYACLNLPTREKSY